MENIADTLFEYLHDVLYAPQQAQLDIDGLPEEFRQLGQGLQYFADSVNEMREFSTALSRGDLDATFPSRGNELAAPLKALHASLKHMTWQSQQVAKGDYQQRLEFLGDFANAFNEMTRQLDQRQQALLAEIESGKRKTLALEQSNSLFEAITEHTPQWIVVVENAEDQWVYLNEVAKQATEHNEVLRKGLNGWFKTHKDMGASGGGAREDELELDLEGQRSFYSITSYPLQWRGQSARAYLITDISAEKQRLQILQDQAYKDTLTGLYNRYYSMQKLTEWMDEGRTFCIGFVDLDNLKYVNDNLGHSEGDNYIIAAARTMEEVWEGAVVSRLGGDEFMLLVPDCDKEQLEARMHEMREEMMQWNGPPEAPYVRSMSYGVVEVDETNQLSSSDLLSQADERMYVFKRAHKAERKSWM